MAKKAVGKRVSRAKVNKSQWVRDYFGKNPEAGPKAVVQAAAAAGITVLPSQVANIKSKLGLSKPRKGTKMRPAPGNKHTGLREIVDFIESVGPDRVEDVIRLMRN